MKFAVSVIVAILALDPFGAEAVKDIGRVRDRGDLNRRLGPQSTKKSSGGKSKSKNDCGPDNGGGGGGGGGGNGITSYDVDATPNAIFGDGNTNGFFTCTLHENVRVCLRGKQRFPKFNPNGEWSNGDGTYTVTAGDACSDNDGFSFAPCEGTPIWSFEWSINTDYDGSTADRKISHFDYELGLGCDPASSLSNPDVGCPSDEKLCSDFTKLFPFQTALSTPYWDHSFGDNSTPQSGGTNIDDTFPNPTAAFETIKSASNVVQQSWNYEFFNAPGTCLWNFDPNVEGTYEIYLKVIDGNDVFVETTIKIITDLTQPLESSIV